MNHAIQHDNVHHLIPINRTGNRRTLQSIMDLRDATASAIRDSKVTYKVLAKKTGKQAQTISNIASGTTHEPRASTCLAILFALNYNIDVWRG